MPKKLFTFSVEQRWLLLKVRSLAQEKKKIPERWATSYFTVRPTMEKNFKWQYNADNAVRYAIIARGKRNWLWSLFFLSVAVAHLTNKWILGQNHYHHCIYSRRNAFSEGERSWGPGSKHAPLLLVLLINRKYHSAKTVKQAFFIRSKIIWNPNNNNKKTH